MTDQTAAAVEQTPAEVTTEAAPEAFNEDAELGAAWDALQDDQKAAIEAESEGAQAEDEEPSAEQQEPEQPAEDVEAPSYLPEAARAAWKDVPEAARTALDKSYREMTDKLATQGRVVSVLKPLHDSLNELAQEIPQIAEFTPKQLAQETQNTVRWRAQFEADPAGTVLGIINEYKLTDAVRSKLGGAPAEGEQPQQQAQQQNTALVQEIQSLKAQIARMGDPSLIDQRVANTLTQRDLEREVSTFAQDAEHWNSLVVTDDEGNVIRNDIAAMLPIARQRKGEGASARDVLTLAYDMAIHADPDLRAKVKPAAAQAPEADPQRKADAARAASINVSSRGTAKPRQKTEDELLEDAWQAAQRG